MEFQGSSSQNKLLLWMEGKYLSLIHTEKLELIVQRTQITQTEQLELEETFNNKLINIPNDVRMNCFRLS